MRKPLTNLLFVAAALGFTATAPLFAAILPITVANPGFESPFLADGASSGAVSGWSEFGNVEYFSAWNPTVAFYANGVPEGQNVGDVYLSGAFTGCQQTLQGAEGQFQADVTYELKVKVGRNLQDPFGGYILQLVVNNVVIAQDDNSRAPAAGSFVTASVKYFYNAALHSALVGQPIQIRLLSKGLGGGFGDVNFDDVQLTYDTSNPVAKHGGPYRLSQGDSLTVNGSASIPSPGAASINTYEWDFNSNDNGGIFNINATGATPAAIPYTTLTNTYGMVFGANTIRIRVTDSAAKIAISTATVTIYPLYTYTGPNTSNGNTERWNVTANWSAAAVPSGLVDVLIPAGKTIVPVLSGSTPTYTGNLSIGANSQISIGWTTSSLDAAKSLGTPGSTVITMASDSSINYRIGGTPIVPAISLIGNASVILGSSTQTGAQASFNHPITGNYRFSLYGNSTTNCVANFNTPNTFNEIYTAGGPYVDGGVTIRGNAPGSLGPGNLTLTALTGGGNSGLVVINAENAMADSATLSMDGNSALKITMNANDKIARLVINGAQMPAGTYGSSTSAAAFKQTWMAGTAVLTVTEGQANYWDVNGATAGAGGATPSGTWDSSSTSWSTAPAGGLATTSWISGRTAVFAAGSDATGAYTVTLGGSNGITVTNSFTASTNTGTSSFNTTSAGWALNGGNCVAVLISSLNATGFTATYAGQPMTVVPGVNDARNSYVGIAYIISDSLPATGNVVINVPRDMPAINTGAYGNMGTVYSILSLSNVASAGTVQSQFQASGNPPATRSITYSTAVNNSFVVGIASDSNWQNSLKTVVGTCNTVISTAKPAYFNTLQCSGSVTAAGSYTDVYSPSITALITMPFNAKTTPNPLLTSAGQKIVGLGFEEGAVTISGGKLEMQTSSAFTSTSGVTGTIASQISGLSTAGLDKKGLGTVILSNNTNNYTGTTNVLGGTLRLGASNALPNTALALAGEAPGMTATLDLNGYNNTVAGLTLGGSSSTSGSSITTGAGSLTLGGNVDFFAENSPLGATVSGNLSLGASTRTFHIRDSSSAANDLTVSAIISGTGGLAKIGIGTLLLSGNNTYTGPTTVNDGLLALSGSNSAATGGITVNENAAVRFDAPASINGTGENVTINSGGLVCFGPSFVAGSIPAALSDRINPASTGVIAVDNFAGTGFNFASSGLNVYLGALGNVTYTGMFSPNGGVYRLGGGSGTITLSNANALTGGSSLLVGGSVIIANSNNITGATTITSAGRLQIGAGGAAGSLSSSSITNNGMLAFTRSDTFTQTMNFWSVISGTGIVEQSGAGTLVLTGNNSYSGGTNLVSGTLKLGHVNAIGIGSLNIYSGTLDTTASLTLSNNAITLGGNFTFAGTANLNMGTGAVISYGNPVITLNGAAPTLTFGGVMTNISGTNQTLTVNGAGKTLVLGGYKMSDDAFATSIALTIAGTGNVSINGTIEDSSVDEFDVRLGSLTKTGTGTLTLSGINNYTGNTVVSGGVLHLLNASISPPSQNSPIIVNNGGTLAFTLGTTITSSKKLTLNSGHKIKIVDTVNTSVNSYTLMTASSIVAGGTLTLETPIPGYILEIAGNSLRLSKTDQTAPVLLGTNIVDNQGGGPIPPNTLVTYTLTFNEDIDAATVSAVDFDTVGTATITTIANSDIAEIAPGIFTVQCTPTSAGTLRLRIPTSADIRDPANNILVDTPAILDDTTITVAAPNNNWLLSSDILDDKADAPVSPNTPVTYTLYFNRDIDLATVSAVDFDKVGTATIATIANSDIAEIAPGILTVKVTPTTVGTLQLRIPISADIRDTAIPSNMLDSDPAIVDDTTINVVEPYTVWAGNNTFNGDANGDGVSNGLAWLLGASDPAEDALDLLPDAGANAGKLVLSFICLKTANRGGALLKVQYSNDLGLADNWSAHESIVPDTDGTINGVIYDISDLGDYISVEARITPQSGKIFGRLRATKAP